MCIDITDGQKLEILERISVAESRLGCSFNSYCYMELDEDETDDDCMEDVYHLCGAKWMEMGMSKLCLFFDDYPSIVVKIPLRGCNVRHYITDDDGNEYWDDGTEYDYKYATVGDVNTWDYCASEEFYYKMAVKAGIEEMFAETVCIGKTWSGYPVYVSEYIGNESSRMTKMKRDELVASIKENDIQTSYLGTHVVADMMYMRPVKLVADAVRFMRDFEIDGDMHSGNYRYRDDGTLVFIDYSNFNDHTEEF